MPIFLLFFCLFLIKNLWSQSSQNIVSLLAIPQTRIYSSLHFNIIWLTKPDAQWIQNLNWFYSYHLVRLFPDKYLQPPTIMIFPNSDEYRSVLKVPAGQYGHIDFEKKMIYTYKQKNMGVLFHEWVHWGVHLSMRCNERLWFQEGLASLYESPIENKKPNKFEKNRFLFYQKNWRQVKMQMQWTPLQIFMNQVNLPYKHSKAQARLFFLWLAKKQKLISFVQGYRKNCFYDPSGIQTLQEVLGKKLSDINKKMKEFSFSLK